MLFWLIGAVTPFPPPDGSPAWQSVLFFLTFAPLPLGAFYMCARLIRKASGNEQSKQPEKAADPFRAPGGDPFQDGPR